MPENVNTSALVVEGKPEEKEDDRPVMIKVDHVSMSFNMASEQLNSLKEYAVAIAKRKLFFEEFKALDDVSFEVRKGDVFGIMGTNGSGKSTMLKIIAGVLEPTKGTCQVNGNIAPLIELGAGFDMDLSARENIYLNGALLGYSKEFIDENFDAIVEFAEVEKFLDMPLKNYSSGMVARIAFAIATVIVPEILVVDEVLSVGDFMFQKKCEDRITELIEQHGVTVLIVSHNNDQIERLCSKAIWIEKGHERLQGDASMVCRVYGGLGGRTGSRKAEERVFESLVHDIGDSATDSLSEVVAGESLSSTGVKLVSRAWEDKPIDSLVLATDRVHAGAIVGNPLAAALGAPLLSMGDGSFLPESVDQYIRSKKPSKVFLLDCGGFADGCEEALRSMPWHPEVIRFGVGLDLLGFSLDVLAYGANRSLWGREISVIHLADNAEAMVSAPWTYSKKCPVLMYKNGDEESSALWDALAGSDVKKVFVFGENAASLIDDGANDRAVASSSLGIYRDVESIAEMTFLHFNELRNFAKIKVCVASKTLGQWPELISCGCFGGMGNAPLLLMDQKSLDSVRDCMDFAKKHANQIDSMIFIGDKIGLNGLERSLLVSQLAS